MEQLANGPDSDRLEQRCGEAVDLLLARRGWKLLDRDEFARRAHTCVCAGIATDPKCAAIYIYSHALHRACSGAEGVERQNLGYTELYQYLYDGARRRYSDGGEDATQQALEAIFTTFERCRHPGAFLAFAFQHLRDAAKALRQREERLPQSLAVAFGGEEHSLAESLADPRQPDPSVPLLAKEQRLRLAQLNAAFLRSHPRAKQQMAALTLKYIQDLDDVTIGRRLGKSPPSIYVLRSRAIAKLRMDPKWRALAREFGIRPGQP